MNPTPEQRAHILAGSDAEEFLETELGKTVIAIAKQDEELAVLAFDEASPHDVKAITKAQIDLKVARRLPQYLSELMIRGRETLDSLRKEE